MDIQDFDVDLTDKLRIGSNNEIRVVADNTQIAQYSLVFRKWHLSQCKSDYG